MQKPLLLEFQPDFPAICDRMTRWWSGEYLGRPPFIGSGVVSERREVHPPSSLEQKWFDMDYILDAKESLFEASEFAGEYVPSHSIDFGSVLEAGFFGTKYTLGDSTVWWHPWIEDWSKTPPFEFDPQNEWFRRICEMLEECASRAKGRYLAALPTFGGPADTLAAMRGTENLLMDLIECPDEISNRLMQVAQLQIEATRTFLDILGKYQLGTTSWWPVWGMKSSFMAQNDFSIMISAEMHREVLLPSLRAITEAFPQCIYHLDGPGALRHVPALCEVPDIRAIMFCEGAGNGPITKWMSELFDIQRQGKSVAQGFPLGAEDLMLSFLDKKKSLLLCNAPLNTACGIREIFNRVLEICGADA